MAWSAPAASTSISSRARTPCGGPTSPGCSLTPRRASSTSCSATTRAASPATSPTPGSTATAWREPGSWIVFCADGLISGNTDTYELEGLKTVSDAAYIHRLSRNVARGYDQKWRLYADPGGHPPLGFARVGERQLLAPVEGPDLDRVRRAFELYASGAWSDTNLADELGLTEAGLTEILTNPLYAGRAIRHKGRPDQEEQPARFEAPIDPALFERVQAIRAQRRTSHTAGGGSHGRRSYPLVRLMRCLGCGSGYHGDAGNGYRRIRHSRRPACGPSATYRAERYEEQLARSFEDLSLRGGRPRAGACSDASCPRAARRAPDPDALATARADLQAQLAAGSIGIEAFSRAWRRLERPQPAAGRAAG